MFCITGTCCCCLCVLMGLVVLFFVAPFSLLAVFASTSAFNSDLSKWNTGAVTNMYGSKCTLSPSLWPRRLPLWCVVEYIRQLEVRRVTSLTRSFLFPSFSKCSTTVASHEHSAVAHGNPYIRVGGSLIDWGILTLPPLV